MGLGTCCRESCPGGQIPLPILWASLWSSLSLCPCLQSPVPHLTCSCAAGQAHVWGRANQVLYLVVWNSRTCNDAIARSCWAIVTC